MTTRPDADATVVQLYSEPVEYALPWTDPPVLQHAPVDPRPVCVCGSTRRQQTRTCVERRMVPRRVTRNGRTRLDLIDGRPVLEPHDRDVALEHRCLDCGAIDRATYEWLFDRIGDPPASVARWYPELMEEAEQLQAARQAHAHT